jgi:hypothetical protein
MAEVALTAALVEPIFPLQAEIYSFMAASDVAKGEVVYMLAAGTVAPADADGAGLQQARGIALNAAGAGQAVSVLKRGHVAGYTVSGLNAGIPLYLSDVIGDLSTTVGTMTVPCAIVVTMTDKDATKVVYADFRWGPDWT